MSASYVLHPGHAYLVALSVPGAYSFLVDKDAIRGKAGDLVGKVDKLEVWAGDEFPKSKLDGLKKSQTTTFGGQSADYVVGFTESHEGNGAARTVTFPPEYVAWAADLGDPSAPAKPAPPPAKKPGGIEPGMQGALRDARKLACKQFGGTWDDSGNGRCVPEGEAPPKPTEGGGDEPANLLPPSGHEGGGLAPLLLGAAAFAFVLFLLSKRSAR